MPIAGLPFCLFDARYDLTKVQQHDYYADGDMHNHQWTHLGLRGFNRPAREFDDEHNDHVDHKRADHHRNMYFFLPALEVSNDQQYADKNTDGL